MMFSMRSPPFTQPTSRLRDRLVVEEVAGKSHQINVAKSVRV